MANTVIDTGNHPVELTGNVPESLNAILNSKGLSDCSSCFVLTDENTRRDCLERIKNILPHNTVFITIQSGESHKIIQSCNIVWEQLLHHGADRKSVLINLGGGMITDLGGFAASTYMRGIRFLNIPTSLVGMVDASCGGKTGIDFMHFKNIIGTFAFPQTVLIDPVFLHTLDEKEWRNGLAEMYKHALLGNHDSWNRLSTSFAGQPGAGLTDEQKELVKSEIIHSVKYKAEIVKADPYEQGNRKFLNFGHTIGHAVETNSLSGTKSAISHGEAVSIGMTCESFISAQLAGLNNNLLDKISTCLTRLFPVRKFSEDETTAIFRNLKSDKKSVSGEITFVLLSDIGKPVLHKGVTEKLILQSLNFYNGL